MISMTGYGRASGEWEGQTLTIEIKAVNHRYIDINCRMPRELLFLEDRIKQQLKTVIHRGRLDVYIHLTGEGLHQKQLNVDYQLVNSYIEALTDIKHTYHLSGQLTIQDILSMTDVFNISEESSLSYQATDQFLAILTHARDQLQTMRETEGLAMASDVHSRLDRIETLTKDLETEAPTIKHAYREKIHQRLVEYTDEHIHDSHKFAQDIAVLAEKGDVSEEITRLAAHVNHARQLTTTTSSGRQLDFIAQELLREANTIGSKSTDVRISEKVVELKSEIEKMKEQVQNIE